MEPWPQYQPCSCTCVNCPVHGRSGFRSDATEPIVVFSHPDDGQRCFETQQRPAFIPTNRHERRKKAAMARRA